MRMCDFVNSCYFTGVVSINVIDYSINLLQFLYIYVVCAHIGNKYDKMKKSHKNDHYG